ncbi:hypothetical protein [Streptomyces sp. NBC_00233]|uniref:LuxE/PaaK family acyltransferase n=1 Tax=Streptomyces sp. NBC_00233 TaxID=2975686 RepID=UPI002253B672|nr:hypothetical protein [Streptomyces sp. NBC_00233]MCX5233514.1 hypothetical protein [Streptomyces sp. NBC_00233]
MELMDMSILRGAGRHITAGLDEPAIVRLVPSEQAAPTMVMAYGMELIARRLGNRQLSASVVSESGIDHVLLRKLLERAIAEQRPVVIIGATSAFVNLCQTMKERGYAWTLPAGSRLVDAGGHKRSRQVTVDEVRVVAADIFGIEPCGHRNLFGMTELASQLYDSDDVPAGPSGERPKGAEAYVRAQVRNPVDLSVVRKGAGLLEVVDLCILDRPCAVLTGDWGIASQSGTAIVGRVANGRPRGCSLALDEVTPGRNENV